MECLEKRDVDKYCNGKEVCDEEEDKFTKLSKVVDDCDGSNSLELGGEPTKKFKEIRHRGIYDCEIMEMSCRLPSSG